MTVEVHQATATTEKVVILEKKSSVSDFAGKIFFLALGICAVVFAIWFFFGDAILVNQAYKSIG